MDDGLLDKSHPAILSVKFMQDSRLELRTRSIGDDNDDELKDASNIAPLGNRYIWMAAAGGLAIVTLLISVGRYRHSSRQRHERQHIDELKKDDSIADFIEVNSEILSDEQSC